MNDTLTLVERLEAKTHQAPSPRGTAVGSSTAADHTALHHDHRHWGQQERHQRGTAVSGSHCDPMLEPLARAVLTEQEADCRM